MANEVLGVASAQRRLAAVGQGARVPGVEGRRGRAGHHQLHHAGLPGSARGLDPPAHLRRHRHQVVVQQRPQCLVAELAGRRARAGPGLTRPRRGQQYLARLTRAGRGRENSGCWP